MTMLTPFQWEKINVNMNYYRSVGCKCKNDFIEILLYKNMSSNIHKSIVSSLDAPGEMRMSQKFTGNIKSVVPLAASD